MSTPSHPRASSEPQPTGPSVRYEVRDVNERAILITLGALAGLVAIAMLLLWPLYAFLSSRVTGSASLPPAFQYEIQPEPVEPRLSGGLRDTSTQQAMQQMRSEAEARLGSYGWIDRDAGIARIPIERAMRLLALRDAAIPEPAPEAEGQQRQGEQGREN